MAEKPATTPHVGNQSSADAAQVIEVPSGLLAQAQSAIQGELKSKDPALKRSRTRPDVSINPSIRRRASEPKLSTYAVDTDFPFGSELNRVEFGEDGFKTKADVRSDGRIDIKICQKNHSLSSLLVPSLRDQLDLVAAEATKPITHEFTPVTLGGLPGQKPPPKLNIAIHVVGSRGDVQPFVALGKTLKSTYGHRIRLATHPVFKDFVEENGLEFFSITGDPAELMAFMVKNPGLMPGFDSLKSGDVGKRRRGIESILVGCWRSCIEAGDGMDPASQDLADAGPNITAATGPLARPFIADAIIANPPSFAHIHIAEKMGIPLHMMFTMPWCPTQSFPHPLADIRSSDADAAMTHFISYALVELMTWQGLGDIINRFRQKALGLDPVSLIWAPGVLNRLKIPWTYCWSPALIPKPNDWGRHISIAGFYFLPLASTYKPDSDLETFLATGPPPVYIGFGSIVVDDPDALTRLIFEAVRKMGVRALVSKGWGGIGAQALGTPDNVFMLGNVPHDWLFRRVSCVVHHGGAGTSAAGIALGRPTVVVPFFGDQPFWGAMIARAGAGPPPIPYKQLTVDNLASAIQTALTPQVLAKASELSKRISEEQGTEVGSQSFHDNLNIENMRCSLAPNRVAVWRIRRTKTKLSALAAHILASNNLLTFSDLKLYRPNEYETEEAYGPSDPISGGASAMLGTVGGLTMGIADFPMELFKAVKYKGDEKRIKLQLAGDTASSVPAPKEVPGKEPIDMKAKTLRGRSHTTSGAAGINGQYDDDALSLKHLPKAGSSLREALGGGSSGRSRSRSRTRSFGSRGNSPSRFNREVEPSAITLQSSIYAGKSIARVVSAGLKSPMDFTMGIARGFHNAPKLYGDDTVRPHEKVTDLQSGLVAAGKGFGYGFYDGITGLVTQPYRGAEKEGAAGLLKGIGKGLAGVVLKPGAGIWGLPGYAYLGLHREIKKLFGADVTNYVITARTAQGFEDAIHASDGEKNHILDKWRDFSAEYQRSHRRSSDEDPRSSPSSEPVSKGFWQTRHMSFDERKKLHADRESKRKLLHRRTPSESTQPDDTESNRTEAQSTPKLNEHASITPSKPPSSFSTDDGSERTKQAQPDFSNEVGEDFDGDIRLAMAASLEDMGRKDGVVESELSRNFVEGRKPQQTVDSASKSEAVVARQQLQPDTEEDIVLRYVMKQSLLEEELK